jgi:hypothetical protein
MGAVDGSDHFFRTKSRGSNVLGQFSSDRGRAFPNFLGDCVTGSHLKTFRSVVELTCCTTNPIFSLGHSRFQHDAVQGDDGHNRVIRVDSDSVLNENFSGKVLEVGHHRLRMLERERIQLLEKVSLNDLQALFGHDRQPT